MHSKGFSSFHKQISIHSRNISSNTSPLLVAEIGINHNGDMDLAKRMIESAKKAGADAIKCQSYTIDKFINPQEKKTQSLYQLFKKYELSLEQHIELRKICEQCNILFFSTPLSIDWVKKLEELDVPMYKVASGDLNNYWLLQRIMATNKPILVSTGASSFRNIQKTVRFLQKHNKQQVILLHCVSLYPTPIYKINIFRMHYLQKNFEILTGFSDHTSGTDAVAYAVLAGACVIEKHFTMDKRQEGPDHKFSATPQELKIIRHKIDTAFEIRQNTQKDSWPEEFNNDDIGKRSLYNVNDEWIPMRPKKGNLVAASDMSFFKKFFQ